MAARRKGMKSELQGEREKTLQERMGDSAGCKGRPGKALCVVERQALQEGEWEGLQGGMESSAGEDGRHYGMVRQALQKRKRERQQKGRR